MTKYQFICPLCQQNNNCAINTVEPCWCTTKKIPAALIAQVPAEKKNKSCICANCVDKFNRLALGAS
ncbi:cysteine-rich CWC family protein [Colwellia sp. UCD-KL20]|uniref:cysteine-rich CWC family protein n=1 Tax=Colwellia sp. UCD-KL20 TaxID=1917165 RepID=UPI000970CE13|nr:cysteine-rich CWC family protein [Colwellia sp. UCD-KL20]